MRQDACCTSGFSVLLKLGRGGPRFDACAACSCCRLRLLGCCSTEGPAAHTREFDKERGDWEPFSRLKDKLTSFQRFMANSYTDAEKKQDAINLVLGQLPARQESAPPVGA